MGAPKKRIRYDPLAQPVEQLPFKQWVRGSSPRRVTRKRDIRIGYLFFCPAGTRIIQKPRYAGGISHSPVRTLGNTFISAQQKCKRVPDGSPREAQFPRNVVGTCGWQISVPAGTRAAVDRLDGSPREAQVTKASHYRVPPSSPAPFFLRSRNANESPTGHRAKRNSRKTFYRFLGKQYDARSL